MSSASLVVEVNPPVSERFTSAHVNAHKVGLVFGTLYASWHVLWSFLVWVGAAQPILDFVFRLHMIVPAVIVGPFNLGTAAALVVVTAAAGYAIGWALGFLWNRFGPQAA